MLPTRSAPEPAGADPAGEDLASRARRLETLVLSLSNERAALTADLATARASFLAQAVEHRRLCARLNEISVDHERLAGLYAAVERESTVLGAAYVMSQRLHGTRDRAAVLQATEEIVASLVGCEQMVLLERMGDGLLPLRTVGVGEARLRELLASPLLGRALASGELQLGSRPVACVPLKLDEVVTGVLVLDELLPQKRELADGDPGFLALLGSQLATAVHCSRIAAGA
jgi:hypothetical protein